MFSDYTVVKPLTGVWLHSEVKKVYRCSRCGCEIPENKVSQYHNCPECHASMRKAG